MNLDALPPLRDVIKTHNLSAQKALGQNFLLDQNITDKIVRAAGDISQSTIFEIGPGPGGLTRSILRARAPKLIALEFDERAIKALQGLKDCANGVLDIHHADALNTNLLALSCAPRAIIANLPYNIATPLLIGWLKQIHTTPDAFSSMTLMFQKEVGQRITATPAEKSYGRLSVMCQWLCNVENVYDLPPTAFTPPPKVNSRVIHFTPKKRTQNDPDFQTMERITAAAFNQRRKMIRSSLKAYRTHIEELGIDPTRRAETLSVQEYINLAKLLQAAD